jgi:hypothetical protein
LRIWREKVVSFTTASRITMQSYVSAGIFKHTISSLQIETGYSIGLCKRLLNKKCLWLWRYRMLDIDKMHEADLMHKYNPLGQGLDVIELAAVYSALPSKFRIDPTGKKEKFRSSVEELLREMLKKKELGKLSKNMLHCPLYDTCVNDIGFYGTRASFYKDRSSSSNRNNSKSSDGNISQRQSNISQGVKGASNPIHGIGHSYNVPQWNVSAKDRLSSPLLDTRTSYTS